MNTDVEFHIRQNYPWNKLPANVKQVLCANVSTGQSGRGAPLCPKGVNLSMSPRCSLQAAVRVARLVKPPLQGLHRSAGAITDHHYITAIEAPLPLLNFTDITWLFDGWRHMMLARGCHLQILHSHLCAQCVTDMRFGNTTYVLLTLLLLCIDLPPVCHHANTSWWSGGGCMYIVCSSFVLLFELPASLYVLTKLV